GAAYRAPDDRQRGQLNRTAAVIGGALVLAAASLLLPWALAFDPQAWVVWGRDLGRLALDTRGGPSWKPLPVVFTTPLSITASAAPAVALLLVRADTPLCGG